MEEYGLNKWNTIWIIKVSKIVTFSMRSNCYLIENLCEKAEAEFICVSRKESRRYLYTFIYYVYSLNFITVASHFHCLTESGSICLHLLMIWSLLFYWLNACIKCSKSGALPFIWPWQSVFGQFKISWLHLSQNVCPLVHLNILQDLLNLSKQDLQQAGINSPWDK